MVKDFRRCFTIVCAVAMMGLVHVAMAQSGRNKRKPTTGTAPPAATAAVEPSKSSSNNEGPADDTKVKITSILVTGKVFHPYAYYESSFLDTAVKECVSALKARRVAVAKAEKTDFGSAKELAKKESDAVVLWLGFETKDDGAGNQYLDYVDYAVLLPHTAKILTQGRIQPGEASAAITGGGVLSLPRRTTRSSPIQADHQMRLVAVEVVNRLTLGGWLD
jgi:hypothetical protein